MTPNTSDYVVFVDESGDHSLESINPEWPIFVLCFCIFPIEGYVHQLTPAIRSLKFDFFGHDLVILHEHDIRKKKGAFKQLNKEMREAFLNRLTDIIAATDMTMIAVVIDKENTRQNTPNLCTLTISPCSSDLNAWSHFLPAKVRENA